MGYMIELNTLLGLPKEFDIATLEIGKRYTITRDRERAYPLHIAVLLIGPDWDFLGYVVARSMKNIDQKCEIEFEVLSLFDEKESRLYKEKFLEAARKTGEVK